MKMHCDVLIMMHCALVLYTVSLDTTIDLGITSLLSLSLFNLSIIYRDYTLPQYGVRALVLDLALLSMSQIPLELTLGC